MRLIVIFCAVFLFGSVYGQRMDKRLNFMKDLGVAPTYVGCENLTSQSERKECTVDSIRNFVARNTNQFITPPTERLPDDVYIRFGVDTNGAIHNIRLALPSKSGDVKLHSEALRVVESLPKMIAATINDQKVGVEMVEVIIFQGRELPQIIVQESLPVWSSCLDEKTEEDQVNCTNKNMRDYLNEKAEELLPSNFKVMRLKATARCKFYINENGTAEDISIISSTNNAELDSLAVEIVKGMPEMQPGTRGEKPTRFEYSMSMWFK